jgi:hypothetical protein
LDLVLCDVLWSGAVIFELLGMVRRLLLKGETTHLLHLEFEGEDLFSLILLYLGVSVLLTLVNQVSQLPVPRDLEISTKTVLMAFLSVSD